MKQLLTVIIFGSFFYVTTPAVLHPTPYTLYPVAHAQSPTTQKALENVREGVSTLAETKDGSALDNTGLKIETFKKVVDLALSEVKDLKTKFLSVENIESSSSLALWQEHTAQNLNTIIVFYTKQKEEIETTEQTLDTDSVKLMAERFKEWRENEYLPQETQVRDFLLIEQENKAINTAEKRLEKIGNDLARLQKAKIKNFSSIQKLFEKAANAIKTARVSNSEAENAFFERYVSPLLIRSATSSPVQQPQEETTTSTTTVTMTITTTTMAETTIVSTSSVPSETSSTPTFFQPSIRDLVKDSLSKIKEAYQIFIEMSNLVRKLLR